MHSSPRVLLCTLILLCFHTHKSLADCEQQFPLEPAFTIKSSFLQITLSSKAFDLLNIVLLTVATFKISTILTKILDLTPIGNVPSDITKYYVPKETKTKKKRFRVSLIARPKETWTAKTFNETASRIEFTHWAIKFSGPGGLLIIVEMDPVDIDSRKVCTFHPPNSCIYESYVICIQFYHFLGDDPSL